MIKGIAGIGSKANFDALAEIQDINVVREVIGCLLENAQLYKAYKFSTKDFTDTFHQVVLGVIQVYAEEGQKTISPETIGPYLQNGYQAKYNIFNNHNGSQMLYNYLNSCHPAMFEINYKTLRKYSFLRELVREGIDISEYFDPNEMDETENEKKKDKFNNQTLEEIAAYYKNKIMMVSEKYLNSLNTDSVKAGGDEALMQKESWKISQDFGLNYASKLFTTITNGIRRKRFTVLSASTGVGKTRMSIANICYSFAPKFWDIKDKVWKDNPHGTQNCALYIGTEMELREEVEPIIWAYMAAVPEDHITLNQYEPGEEERVNEAIQYLRSYDENGREQNCGIYLEYLPDYCISSLEQVIEKHVLEHNVSAVYFDYIHPTSSLLAEYGEIAGKMAAREDQALGNLSSRLKELTRKYNISIDSWTQVSGDFKNENNRDQTIVRGARSIIDKVDIGGIVSRPTDIEKKKLDRILHLNFDMPEPNMCISVYKNRGGRHVNKKIWLYVDYATMRVKDLFVTNYDYEIEDIAASRVIMNEDKTISVYTNKDEYYRDMQTRFGNELLIGNMEVDASTGEVTCDNKVNSDASKTKKEDEEEEDLYDY